MIVAWHEVPGTRPPNKSRPVGYGMIRAGVGTDSMFGVTKFLNGTIPKCIGSVSGHVRRSFPKKHGAHFDEK